MLYNYTMKKVLYLFLICCMGTVASAQKINGKDLQGNWKLAAFNAGGIYLDMNTGLASISDELKSQLTSDEITELNESMKQGIEPLKTSTISFTGTAVKQNIAGQERTGTFEIKEVNGEQRILSTYTDGSTSNTAIYIKDKKLYISKSEQGQTAELIFDKV